ncbi:DNA replication licensing factor REC isoform X2 [Teleopsis dalmanni]|uniref:DNA replication licensing factor REC isoform X2 n=1 Tax=Teleopsis dalmanni TaxID=139649 RepID=UPI0018CD7DFF|nr:DNA replication licensing factor REC isoform X2 [Teleopsis dalmanni]
MNRPRAPGLGRFMRAPLRGQYRGGGANLSRGQSRGGSRYRPYFYFRRGGRTIPAGGANHNDAAANNTTRNPNDALDSTFLRPEHYVAPEHSLQVNSFKIQAPSECPGWCLYFLKDEYSPNSIIAKRIKVLELHFARDSSIYDMSDIQNQSYFHCYLNVLQADKEVNTIWPNIVQDMLHNPLQSLATLGVAMHAAVNIAAIDAALSQPSTSTNNIQRITRIRKIYARPMDLINLTEMRHISNEHLDSMHSVRGIVTAIGDVEATATWVAYKCERCQQEQVLKQTGFYPARPYSCKGSGCLAKKNFVEMRSSAYTRIVPKQNISLSETNINTLVDYKYELPSILDIELRHDLVDSVALGELVVITGVLKLRQFINDQPYAGNIANNQTTENSTQIYMKAITVNKIGVKREAFTERDLEAINKIHGEHDVFKLLVQSMAPEIHGHELEKAGLLLSLFGGSGSQLLEEGVLNVLLVGDPGTGKSYKLQMCAQISERGALIDSKNCSSNSGQLIINTKGRNKQSIDAGALILCKDGHCAIDDVDQIPGTVETLLQAMQSLSITASSFAVSSRTSTPTSIIATSNTKCGHYDESKLLLENIRLEPSLLRQFDLVFVLLDKPDKGLDTTLPDHVKALHAGIKKGPAIAARYTVRPKTNNSMNVTVSDTTDNFEDYNLAEHLKLYDENDMDLLPTILIKKYIAYARQQARPFLNDEATEAIKTFYMDLRNNDSTGDISSGLLRY